MFCKYCGKQLSGQEQFCPACGERLVRQNNEEVKKFCAQCGQRMTAEQTVCPFCGTASSFRATPFDMPAPPTSAASMPAPKPKKRGTVFGILALVFALLTPFASAGVLAIALTQAELTESLIEGLSWLLLVCPAIVLILAAFAFIRGRRSENKAAWIMAIVAVVLCTVLLLVSAAGMDVFSSIILPNTDDSIFWTA